jgi:hypothetical protein
VILIAACYSPVPPSNVPCSVSSDCLQGQACIAGMCGGTTGTVPPDAPPDAIVTPTSDRDLDGVPDLSDNCPDVKNPDQANEDGDRFGDVCDPCPPVRGDAPSDLDGDGVADACDPNPTTPGDHIALFEGFHHGVPAWARSPSWVAAGDAVRVTAGTVNGEYLMPPVSSTDRVTVTAGVAIEQVTGNNSDHVIGVSVPYEASSDSGVECQLGQSGNLIADRYILLWDDFLNRDRGSSPLAWADNTDYAIIAGHRGTSYVCNVTEANGTSHLINATSSASATQPATAIRAFALTARVTWVLVVTSP